MATNDPEVEAISILSRTLGALDLEIQRRVLQWANSRYGFAPQRVPAPRPRIASEDDNVDSEGGNMSFKDFVDLFDSVNPKTDLEKALTAGYWVQQGLRQPSWRSQQLNDFLKDAGHGVGNITLALDHAQERTPALVRQMSKSGKSRQARKTYKLTTAGLQFIGSRAGTIAGAVDAGETEDEQQ
jgi:hypothetical protein